MILKQVRVLLEIGDTMRVLFCLLLLWSMLLSGCGKSKENEKEDAVAAIKKLGGKVQINGFQVGEPVVKVDLSGQPAADAGLVVGSKYSADHEVQWLPSVRSTARGTGGDPPLSSNR